MRTTINISEELVKEAEALYNTTNRSKAIESALKDAIMQKKQHMLMQLKGRLNFDEEAVKKMRSAEIDESEDNC